MEKTERFDLKSNKWLFIACTCPLRQGRTQHDLEWPVLILPISSSLIHSSRIKIYKPDIDGFLQIREVVYVWVESNMYVILLNLDWKTEQKCFNFLFFDWLHYVDSARLTMCARLCGIAFAYSVFAKHILNLILIYFPQVKHFYYSYSDVFVKFLSNG